MTMRMFFLVWKLKYFCAFKIPRNIDSYSDINWIPMQEKMATIPQLSKFSLQVLNIRMITVEELNKFQYCSQITISKGPQNQFIDDRRIFQLFSMIFYYPIFFLFSIVHVICCWLVWVGIKCTEMEKWGVKYKCELCDPGPSSLSIIIMANTSLPFAKLNSM